MTRMEKVECFDNILRIVPLRIREKLRAAISGNKNEIEEIVLRAQRPVCVYRRGEEYVLTKNGCLAKSSYDQQVEIISFNEITESFNTACNFSVYSHINEIKEGFVTINGGHRVGICGTAVVNSDEIVNIRDISTLSLRFAREVIGCGKDIVNLLLSCESGLLLCGSPCSGKTTVLRDVARVLSSEYQKRVSVIDTRGEIASVSKGVSQMHLGFCDVLDSFPRKQGILQAIRVLSPQYIVCDEIGTKEDAQAILTGVNSGTTFVSSMHAGTPCELRNRSYIKDIMETGAFSKIVFLCGRGNPGKVASVLESEELFN